MESEFDAATGSVFFEVEVMLSSDSGRDKHTDVVDQGGWLIIPIKQALTSQRLEGVAFGRIRYWGTDCKPVGEPKMEEDVGSYHEPLDEG